MNLLKVFIVVLFLVPLQLYSQNFKPFYGKLKYEVYFTDSITKKRELNSYMLVYTNDTLVRIETETAQFGKQVTIRHLLLNKYYVLLEVNNRKFAIQHQVKKDSLKESKYVFHKRISFKKIAGLCVKKVDVTSKVYSQKMYAYYLPKISPKYLEVLKGIQGLPVNYFIQTDLGMYEYKLLELEKTIPSKDLFGIPSDYQKVTFDEFISIYSQTN